MAGSAISPAEFKICTIKVLSWFLPFLQPDQQIKRNHPVFQICEPKSESADLTVSTFDWEARKGRMRLITHRICRKGKDWIEKGLSDEQTTLFILGKRVNAINALTA